VLEEGMVLAIEPMLCEKRPEIYFDNDGWTIRTQDGGLAAHFEHTIAVTKDGPRVLT
jgi:methionyl aminopeptidase